MVELILVIIWNKDKKMSMFCYQCQETAKGIGCTKRGVCGKSNDLANMQDLLIYVLKGISIYSTRARELVIENEKVNQFIFNSLFMTITNANWDRAVFVKKIKEGIKLREEIKNQLLKAGGTLPKHLPDCATWEAESEVKFEAKANSSEVGVLAVENEDVRSLR